MLTISKALSSGQAQTYHSREFASEQQNYWSRDQRANSEWQGKLAEEWNLIGPVRADHFAHLSEGRHPESGAQLVKHQPARTYENEYGKQITSAEHRAGWDATFSAPKSVSLTALVGGDDRVRDAHRESVRVALSELERYTQARIGNVHAPETTGRFVAATFEHDTARPVEGYAAPQLHTHAVIFNVTERENGQTRALQERSLFHSGQGQTADRVLIHVDTELGAKDLLNNRMAYVSVSRGQWDAQIFTNDRITLKEAFSRNISHESAHKPERAISPIQEDVAQSPQPARPHGMEVGIGV
jgi:conjugative relaxase-like TrwC/TraI family protein